MSCPLCRTSGSRPSWLGALRYRSVEYPYLECSGCHSLYADPMPDGTALAQMYGADYQPGSGAAYAQMDDPKEPERVVRWLAARTPGTFVDYGCGPGHLLAAVKSTGWRAMGVEFDEQVAADAAKRSGAEVANRFTVEQLFAEQRADVLHLGDVIEHLTDPDREMPRILRLLKPGGLLMAQGPLEANTTLFTTVLRGARQLRRSRVSEMAPYHVLLATADGQRRFFDRFGLHTVEFSMHEVSWPAPTRLRFRDLASPRTTGLFALRRLSQWCSRLRPTTWGNRYFYVGKLS